MNVKTVKEKAYALMVNKNLSVKTVEGHRSALTTDRSITVKSVKHNFTSTLFS